MDNLITVYVIGVILMVPAATSLIMTRSSNGSKIDIVSSVLAGLMIGVAWPWYITKWIIVKLRT